MHRYSTPPHPPPVGSACQIQSRVLLVSGSHGGGIAAIGPAGTVILDELPSCGLCMAGDLLVRIIAALDPCEPDHMAIYDEHGLVRLVRLDCVRQAHDVMWTGEGRLLATAFGRWSVNQGWAEDSAANLGVIIEVPSGEVLLRGLNKPHHAHRHGEFWVVCCSGEQRLCWFDDDGTETAAVPLRGYSRGLAQLGDLILVGESLDRFRTQAGRAGSSVAMVNRATMSVEGRIPLPFTELYDIKLVPAVLADAVGAAEASGSGIERGW